MAVVLWQGAYETVPVGTDAGSTLDDVIRSFKEQIRLRMEYGGHNMWEATPNENYDGRHCVDAGGSGVSPHIYKADKTTKLVDITDARVYVTEPLYGSQATSIIPIPSLPAATRIPGLMIINGGAGTLVLDDARLFAGTPPSGGALTVDMHRLADTFTDPTATADPPDDGSIWNTIPSIADGLYKAGPFSDFSAISTSSQLAVGEAWVFELDAVNGANNILFTLQTHRIPV